MTQIRVALWALVALAVVGAAVLLVTRSGPDRPDQEAASGSSKFGGAFTLVDAEGRPFSSTTLKGRPYAIYFGFTRCGDVCPTTLSRMVRLRNELGSASAFDIVFVTIDPTHDGPKEVGQYADLFNSPIIGLTGSPEQIDKVKKQFGIYAQPVPNAPMGQEMEHSAVVLLIDRAGDFVTTISTDEPDSNALEKLRRLTA